jgi:hypothetical protein
MMVTSTLFRLETRFIRVFDQMQNFPPDCSFSSSMYRQYFLFRAISSLCMVSEPIVISRLFLEYTFFGYYEFKSYICHIKQLL